MRTSFHIVKRHQIVVHIRPGKRDRNIRQTGVRRRILRSKVDIITIHSIGICVITRTIHLKSDRCRIGIIVFFGSLEKEAEALGIDTTANGVSIDRNLINACTVDLRDLIVDRLARRSVGNDDRNRLAACCLAGKRCVDREIFLPDQTGNGGNSHCVSSIVISDGISGNAEFRPADHKGLRHNRSGAENVISAKAGKRKCQNVTAGIRSAISDGSGSRVVDGGNSRRATRRVKEIIISTHQSGNRCGRIPC